MNLVRIVVNSMVDDMNSMVCTCNCVSQSHSDEVLKVHISQKSVSD